MAAAPSDSSAAAALCGPFASAIRLSALGSSSDFSFAAPPSLAAALGLSALAFVFFGLAMGLGFGLGLGFDSGAALGFGLGLGLGSGLTSASTFCCASSFESDSLSL
jgi:hypothetical protein